MLKLQESGYPLEPRVRSLGSLLPGVPLSVSCSLLRVLDVAATWLPASPLDKGFNSAITAMMKDIRKQLWRSRKEVATSMGR